MLLTRRTSQVGRPEVLDVERPLRSALLEVPGHDDLPVADELGPGTDALRFGFETVAVDGHPAAGPSRQNGTLKPSRGASVPLRFRIDGTSGAYGSGAVGVPISANIADFESGVRRAQPRIA